MLFNSSDYRRLIRANLLLKRLIYSAAAVGTVGTAIYHYENTRRPTHFNLPRPAQLLSKSLAAENDFLKPPARKDLPTFSMDEVKNHGRNARRIWVTYRQVNKK